MNFDLISILIGLVVGALLVIVVNTAIGRNAKKEAKKVLEEANNQAKNTVKQAVLDGKTQVYDLKLQAEKEIRERKNTGFTSPVRKRTGTVCGKILNTVFPILQIPKNLKNSFTLSVTNLIGCVFL